MTHAHSSLETGLFLLSKSCTPFTVAENEMLKSFNVLSFFQCRKQIHIQLKETGDKFCQEFFQLQIITLKKIFVFVTYKTI